MGNEAHCSLVPGQVFQPPISVHGTNAVKISQLTRACSHNRSFFFVCFPTCQYVKLLYHLDTILIFCGTIRDSLHHCASLGGGVSHILSGQPGLHDHRRVTLFPTSSLGFQFVQHVGIKNFHGFSTFCKPRESQWLPPLSLCPYMYCFYSLSSNLTGPPPHSALKTSFICLLPVAQFHRVLFGPEMACGSKHFHSILTGVQLRACTCMEMHIKSF